MTNAKGRAKRMQWTAELDAILIEDTLAGKARDFTASRLGCSRGAIQHRRRALGVTVNPKKKASPTAHELVSVPWWPPGAAEKHRGYRIWADRSGL